MIKLVARSLSESKVDVISLLLKEARKLGITLGIPKRQKNVAWQEKETVPQLGSTWTNTASTLGITLLTRSSMRVEAS